MLVPVLVEAKAVEPGDRLVFMEEGMFHERRVHKVARGSLIFETGEKLKLVGTVIAVREIDHETLDLTDEIADERDRDDLRQVEAARARCARYELDDADPLYWDVYHRGPEWRQRLAGAGYAVAEEDQG